MRILLYPELEHFAAGARAEALKSARRRPFDWVELVGLGASIVLVTSLTSRLARTGIAPDLIGSTLGNFLVAVPLLAVTAGPFCWRRTRRALRDELAKRNAFDRETQ